MANRYWVGGTGTWADTTHWSTTSGGVGGASIPTYVDNVYFNANSFTGTGQIVTLNINANCLDMDWTGATNNPTLTGIKNMTIYGSLIFISAMNLTATGGITLNSTSIGNIINTAGNILGIALSFNGVGGSWTLQSNLTTTNSLIHNNGTIDTNANSITCTSFSSSSGNIRAITLRASTITCSNNWDVNSTGLTFNAGISTIIMAGASTSFTGGGLTYYNVNFTGTPITIINSNTFSQIGLTAGNVLNVTSGTTQTVTSIIANGTLGNLITIQSTTTASPFTLSRASGIQKFNYCSIRDCIGTSGATFTATNSIDGGGNTGITFIGYSHKVMSQLITKIYGLVPSKVIGS